MKNIFENDESLMTLQDLKEFEEFKRNKKLKKEEIKKTYIDLRYGEKLTGLYVYVSEDTKQFIIEEQELKRKELKINKRVSQGFIVDVLLDELRIARTLRNGDEHAKFKNNISEKDKR